MIEMGRCLNNLGAEQFYIGQFEAAEASLLRAVETYRRIDSYEVDAPLNNLGVVLTQEGRMRQALRFLSEADQRASEDFNKICIASNITSIERHSRSRGRARRATPVPPTRTPEARISGVPWSCSRPRPQGQGLEAGRQGQPPQRTLEQPLDHLSTSEEIDWGEYSGALVEFDVFLRIEPAYFGPMDPYAKTIAVEGIRNIIFGLQITSAVKDLPTKDDLIRLGALPSPTAEHHEFTQEEGEREKGNRSSRNQVEGLFLRRLE